MSDRPLTTKQRLFVEFYLADPNGTQAAKKAGYKGTDNALGVMAKKLLSNAKILALVSKRVTDAVMSADEVLRRLSEHASASLADVLTEDGVFNLATAKANGKDHLLKKLKVRYDKEGTTHEYEIHDPQAALVHLGRYHKLFTDKTEHSGEVEVATRVILPTE